MEPRTPTTRSSAGIDAGVKVFDDIVFEAAGARSVDVVDAADASATGTESTAVTAAAASHFSVTGYPSPTTAGVADNVTVTAKDPFDNTDPAYAGIVRFSSSDGAAVLPADGTLTDGTGSFSVTLKTAGSRSITATDTVSPRSPAARPGSP